MDHQEVIAEKTIYAVDKDGRGFDIGLQIGRPYKSDSPHGDWRCPFAVVGLRGSFGDMYGVDSWQAMVLAIDLIGNLLGAFVESDGGKLYSEKDGQELTVNEAFGIPYRFPDDEPVEDEDLTLEEQQRLSLLSTDEIAAIDAALLRDCSDQFRKIARVVGGALLELCESIPNVPDRFYAIRVRQLVADGRLESQGNIAAMRFGEVKLASSQNHLR